MSGETSWLREQVDYVECGMTNIGDLVEKQAVEIEALRDKVLVYERFLHALRQHTEVEIDADAVRTLVANACLWSHAQQGDDARAFERLLDMGSVP